jgi:hypothetical protein
MERGGSPVGKGNIPDMDAEGILMIKNKTKN